MFGPLPPIHRALIVAGALVVFVGICWILAYQSPTVLTVVGPVVGILLGSLAAWALVHGRRERRPTGR